MRQPLSLSVIEIVLFSHSDNILTVLPVQNRLGEEASRYCVFWDFSLQAWSGEGCRAVFSTLIGRGMSRLGSHWSRDVATPALLCHKG